MPTPSAAHAVSATNATTSNVIPFPGAPSFDGGASEPTFKITTGANSFTRKWVEKDATLDTIRDMIVKREVRDDKEGFCFCPSTLLVFHT
jgi:hypothetical protein